MKVENFATEPSNTPIVEEREGKINQDLLVIQSMKK